jgi:hypothetical protein
MSRGEVLSDLVIQRRMGWRVSSSRAERAVRRAERWRRAVRRVVVDWVRVGGCRVLARVAWMVGKKGG